MSTQKFILIGVASVTTLAAFIWALRGSDQDVVDDAELDTTDEPQSLLDEVYMSAREVAATVTAWTNPSGEQYRPLFNAAELKYEIPQGLLFRQAYQESHFRDDIITGKVRSKAGAVGIMQIIPKYYPDLGEAGALNPATAIPYAAKVMSSLYQQFGSWTLALAAYNAGPGNVRKYGGIPPFAETQKYVSQILSDVNVGVA